MRPNDIDNKLKDAFVSENSAPKPELWNNIVSTLDNAPPSDLSKINKPFLPKVFKVLVVSTLLITIAALYFNKEESVKLSDNQIEDNSILEGGTISENKENGVILIEKSENNLNFDTKINKLVDNSNKNEIKSEKIVSKNSKKTSTENKKSTKNKKESIANSEKNTEIFNAEIFHIESKVKLPNNTEKESNKFSNISSSELAYLLNNSFNFGNSFLLNKIKYNKNLEEIEHNPSKFKRYTRADDNEFFSYLRHKKVLNIDEDDWEFKNKLWIGFGISFVRNFNKANIDPIKEKYTHKDFWGERSKLTGNGTGYAINCMLNYYFYQDYSFETGIEFMNRAEQIRIDLKSSDIPVKDAKGKIEEYIRVGFWLIDSNSGDTLGFYNTSVSYNLGADNKYQVFSIPLRVNKEFFISDNSLIKVGVGSNLSYFRSNKRSYLDFIENERMVYSKSRGMFNANVHAQLGIYTVFNGIGEVGFYTIYGKQLKDWQVDTKQYSITMSDLQFGLSYRMPIGKKK